MPERIKDMFASDIKLMKKETFLKEKMDMLFS